MDKRRALGLIAALLAVVGGLLAWWAVAWYSQTYDALHYWYELKGSELGEAEVMATRAAMQASGPQAIAAAVFILTAAIIAILAACSPRRPQAQPVA